jgi:uncharacterized protein
MNRLASEKSPYLLQHASNPVEWFPWGEDAFEAARRLDRPIFLSVGYSTCHWCHVMAHESFENERVAAILNRHFVSIKVDREERPDVDRIYMAFVQATTGSGGWPMSVWLLPDLRPFYGGTYFPPASAWGRPGFEDLLLDLARLWREERDRVRASAEGATDHLTVAARQGGGFQVPGGVALDDATRDLLSAHDRRYGGFGGAPKFPRPSELLFLLREHRRKGDRAPLDAVLQTLAAMAAGGIHDHLGGGFHRYSVDGQWRVPHFEKMLYDQAQLVLAYNEAAQASGDRFFLDVAGDTLRYVQRDLTDPGGGFYSAEDADSLPPDGVGQASEGAFYLWSFDEISHLLGPDAQVFSERFGVQPNGNALQDPRGDFAGRNILYEAKPLDDLARDVGQTRDDLEHVLARSRDLLFRVRAARPRPHLDDKVLTAWNGLMIAAFARASRAAAAFDRGTGDPSAPGAESYLASAQRAAAFIRDRMWAPGSGRLLRRYRDGEAAIDGYAEDYACLVFGLLELFQADGDPAWLEWAVAVQRAQDERFLDEQAGGWYSTSGHDSSLLLRLKEDYDGAEPAASSVAAANVLALSRLGAAGASSAASVERALALFAPRIAQAPRAVPMMLCVLSAWHAPKTEVVVAGASGDTAADALVFAMDRTYQPFAVLVRSDPNGDRASRLAAQLPWVAGQGMRDGRPTAYVCRSFACDQPVTDAAALLRLL